MAETCSRLETQLEELRMELDEEREISLSAQTRLEDQLQINNQLEAENVQLRSTINKVQSASFCELFEVVVVLGSE